MAKLASSSHVEGRTVHALMKTLFGVKSPMRLLGHIICQRDLKAAQVFVGLLLDEDSRAGRKATSRIHSLLRSEE